MPAFVQIRVDGNPLAGASSFQSLGGMNLETYSQVWSFYQESSTAGEGGLLTRRRE